MLKSVSESERKIEKQNFFSCVLLGESAGSLFISLMVFSSVVGGALVFYPAAPSKRHRGIYLEWRHLYVWTTLCWARSAFAAAKLKSAEYILSMRERENGGRDHPQCFSSFYYSWCVCVCAFTLHGFKAIASDREYKAAKLINVVVVAASAADPWTMNTKIVLALR